MIFPSWSFLMILMTTNILFYMTCLLQVLFFFFFFLKEIMWTRFYGGIKNTEIAKWKALNKKIAFRKFIVIWELFTNWDIPALKTDLKLRGTKLQNGSHLENQKLFTFYIGQLLQWGFPDGSGLVKRVILYPF